MVRRINVSEIYNVSDKEKLGTFPTSSDFDEIIDEDCDIYLPDGTLALTFRKRALKTLMSITPSSKEFEYWRWVSRSLCSDQRGNAAGKDIFTNPEIRLTEGQREFFSIATKKEISWEAAQELLKNTALSRTTYYINKTETDGLVDLEEIEKWSSLIRKKSTPLEVKEEAVGKRNAAKLKWFDNWLEKEWKGAEDKVKVAKAAKKHYVTSQPRGNRVFSTVLGSIDRSGRTPFGRLTVPTMSRWEDFESQKPFYYEVDKMLKETMPVPWEALSGRFSKVKDPRYNLFGTCFTSITVNWNFQVACHYDGNNAQNAVAVLSVLENGSYDGYEFVFPQLRLAFNIRHGDFLAGDNQGLMHAMMPMKNASEDAECIMFVFYQRDNIIKLDSIECETCRRDFLDYCAKNHKELGTGEAKWAGSFGGMWSSSYWEDYKAMRTSEGGYDYMKNCSNTHIKGDLDTSEVVIRQPHMVGQ
jgi:hypothetical protein